MAPVDPDLTAHPDMIAMLREARGWTQQKLAEEAGVTQGYVSKVESRLIEVSGAKLDVFAKALDAPAELLVTAPTVAGLEVSCMFHRRRTSKITVADGKRIEAIGNLTRLSVTGLLAGIEAPPPALRRIDIDEYGSATHIAQLARAQWRVPTGPLPNLMALMDRLGVAVIVRPVGTAGQDAFSTWPDGHVPVVVVNTGLPTDRLRFSLAHELGHVVMHTLPNDEQEDQANEFASELLMPSRDIADDLAGLTTRDFTRLMQLKAKWRVSVGALVKKALTLDVISDRQFKEFRIRMSQMGWNVSEPVALPGEEPTFVSRLIQQRRDQLAEDDDDLAHAALMTPAAFRRHYLTAAASGTATAEKDTRR